MNKLNQYIRLFKCSSPVELHPKEVALGLKIKATHRQKSFLAGRAAAHQSMEFWHASKSPILKTPSGAPLWPPGFIGSISHDKDWAAAIAIPHSMGIKGIGLDIESPKRKISIGILDKIATKKEREDYHLDQGEFGPKALALFGLKEACYKCLHPHLGIYFGFQEAEITFWENDYIELELSQDLITKGAPAKLQGNILHQADRQLALVWF